MLEIQWTQNKAKEAQNVAEIHSGVFVCRPMGTWCFLECPHPLTPLQLAPSSLRGVTILSVSACFRVLIHSWVAHDNSIMCTSLMHRRIPGAQLCMHMG